MGADVFQMEPYNIFMRLIVVIDINQIILGCIILD